MFDTGSTVSTIHYDDPTQSRIIKIGKKRMSGRICKDIDDSTKSGEKDDIELASVKRDMSRNVTDEELQEPLPGFDGTSAPLRLNAIEAWKRILEQSGIRRDPWSSTALDKIKGNALPSLDHSVKLDRKYTRYTRH